MEHAERVQARIAVIEAAKKAAGITQMAFDGIPGVIDRRVRAQLSMYEEAMARAQAARKQGSPSSALNFEKEAVAYKRQAHILQGNQMDPHKWAEAEIEHEEALEAELKSTQGPDTLDLMWADHFMVCRSRIFHDHGRGLDYQGLVHLRDGASGTESARYDASIICYTVYLGHSTARQPDGTATEFHSIEDAKGWVQSHIENPEWEMVEEGAEV